MNTEHRPSATPSGRRKSVADEPVTSVLAPGEVPIFDRELNPDEEVLAALGYKPEFKREFSLWTTFCVSFAVLGLLPSFASTLWFGLGYAGTPGMVWGWIIAMLFIQCVAAGMGEPSLRYLLRGRQQLTGCPHSRTVFINAHFWRALLRRCRSRAAWMGTFCIVGDWVVQLARTGWSASSPYRSTWVTDLSVLFRSLELRPSITPWRP